MTIQVDDAGWGDPVGGVIIGILRVETKEYLAKEIEVHHFQEPHFSQKTFLARGLELVLEGLRCLNIEEGEPIQVCRGTVLDGVREGLVQQGYEVLPTKIEGKLQDLVEASLVEAMARRGIRDLPRVSGKERFFQQLEWIQEDLENREQMVKTGWRNWSKKLRNWRPIWRQRQKVPIASPIIIKLGGSVITDKTEPSTPRLDVIKQLTKEIAAIKTHPVILIHGGGSFGHFLAKRFKIHQGGRSSKKKLGVSETASEMTKLSNLILTSFHAVGRPAIPIRSASIIVTINGRISHMDLEALRMFLKQSFIPILHGDVVADTVKNFTIISGDQIAMYLARLLHARKVIFATDVDGLYTADPKENPEAKHIPLVTPDTLEQVLEQIAIGTAPKTADVTKGMQGKLMEIFKGLPKDCEAIICDIRGPGTLNQIIKGEKVPSTRLCHTTTKEPLC